jgi:hypothetical protein
LLRVDRNALNAHNELVLRLWCVTALLCLSIWAIGSRATVCSSDATAASQGQDSCALGVPSSDDASNRHWDAPVRTAAYLTQSVWTSSIHHAEIAASPCFDTALPRSAGNESPRSTPHPLRPHVRLPLLI